MLYCNGPSIPLRAGHGLGGYRFGWILPKVADLSEHVDVRERKAEGAAHIEAPGLERLRPGPRQAKLGRGDLLAIVAYMAAVPLFFWRIVALGLVPAGYDLLTYFYPYKAYLSQLVRQGEMPLWNPMIFMGAPLLANIQAAVLYPPDALFYLMPTTEALRWSVVLHVFLAAVFTYLFARVSLGLSASASWLAGTCFGLGGFIGAHVGHINQLHAAVWLPLLMLCLEQGATRRSVTILAAGAVIAAIQLLAGHTQEVYYSAWAVGLFAIYLAAFGGAHGRERLWPLGGLAAIFTLGAALGAVQLLPTLELARESYRSGGVPYGEAVVYSVRLKELLDSILPLYFQAPYVELVGYTGVVSLALVPAALASLRRPPLAWFLAGLAALALLLSLGDSTPAYGWLHRWMPGFDLFRAPGRWLFVYGLAMALLAGMGLDALRAERDALGLRTWLWRYALGVLAGLAILVGLRIWLGIVGQEPSLPHPRAVLTWASFALGALALSVGLVARPRSLFPLGLLLAVAVLELYLAKEPLEYNRPVVASLYTEPRPVHATLAPDSRVLNLAGDQFQLEDEAALLAAIPPFVEPSETSQYLEGTRLKEILTPNMGMAFGFGTIDGYDGGLLPTRRYAELKRRLFGGKAQRSDHTIRDDANVMPDSRQLGALGVDYLLVNQGRGGYDAGWQEMGGQETQPIRVLRNLAAKPRVYVVHAVHVARDESEMLDATATLPLDQVVVLGEDVRYEPPSEPGRDSVLVVSDRPTEAVVDVSLETPGFLVLSDSFYPGWKVYVDGQETRLLRADYALRAVQLPAGRHQVRFVYEPLSVKIGLGVSSLALLVLSAPWLARRIASRGPRC